MPTHGSSPPLTGELCSLAERQLQMQTARSATLDTGALGLMAIDAALAALLIGTTGAYDLWIAALVLLGLSFALAIRALRLAGAEETGPSVARLRGERKTHDEHELRESLLADLTAEVRINDHALARKAVLFDRALILMALAILIDLAGRVQ
jgi:hypothetical protein